MPVVKNELTKEQIAKARQCKTAFDSGGYGDPE